MVHDPLAIDPLLGYLRQLFEESQRLEAEKDEFLEWATQVWQEQELLDGINGS